MQISSGKIQGRSNAFRTLSGVVRRGMKDKLANVFLSSLATFQAVVDGFMDTVGGKDVQVCVLGVLCLCVYVCMCMCMCKCMHARKYGRLRLLLVCECVFLVGAIIGCDVPWPL